MWIMWFTRMMKRRAMWRTLRRVGLLHVVGLGAVSGLGACSGRWPTPGTPAATREWPAALVGSWALAGRAAQGGVPDTTVWVVKPGGRLEHREVQVRPQGTSLGVRERVITASRWWTKDRTVDGVRTRVMCTSQRPARNSQCARVTVDTVTDAQGEPRRRFTWTGVTFHRQHWTFTERTTR